MKVSINIECLKCGSKTEVKLKKSRHLCDVSISDNLNGDEFEELEGDKLFSAKQTCPDEATLLCKTCGNSFELTI